jgi:hypothetical protein
MFFRAGQAAFAGCAVVVPWPDPQRLSIINKPLRIPLLIRDGAGLSQAQFPAPVSLV